MTIIGDVDFPDLQFWTAPLLLGGIWNWSLYGALVVQFYVYSYNFPQDRKYIKLLVYSVFLLETVQTALSGADLYFWFASGFGRLDHLLSPFAFFIDLPIMGSMVSLIVQFFFVYRIRVLSEKRSRWLCLIICLFSIVGASGALASGISLSIHHYEHLVDTSETRDQFIVDSMVWLIGNTLSDILIASAMIYHLRRIRAENGNFSTCFSNHILVRIVRLTVETNMMTTTVSIVAVLMIGLFPVGDSNSNTFVCPTYLLGKLYSNTLLVSLNNRISFRDANFSAGGAIVGDLRAVPPTIDGDSLEAAIETFVVEPKRSE